MNDKLNRVIVPMPQFVNPNSPETNAGSVNHTLDSHPVEHAESYGKNVTEEGVAGIEPEPDAPEGNVEGFKMPKDLADKPDGEWTVDDLKEALKAAELPVSGNKDELQARWAAFKSKLPSDEQ